MECYSGDEPGLVPRGRERRWSEYVILLAKAILDDLLREQEGFRTLAGALLVHVALSHIRMLDVVAWSSRAISTP